MKLDRQAVLDAACLLIGSAVGAGASAAFFVHRFMKAQLGAPEGERRSGSSTSPTEI